MQAILGGVMVAVGYNYTWEHHNGGNVDGVSTDEWVTLFIIIIIYQKFYSKEAHSLWL